MLTGNTKILFKEWYSKGGNFTYLNKISYMPKYEVFPTLPFEFQIGVYLEFLRAQHINIVQDRYTYTGDFRACVLRAGWEAFEFKDPGYNKCIIQAIEKCNELINNQ